MKRKGKPQLCPAFTGLLLLLSLAIYSNAQESCAKDVVEDVCNEQHEGFDPSCERRCLELFPLRLSSSCQLRSSGTLLSFFGIRSFVCVCMLPSAFCLAESPSRALSLDRLTFSFPAIQVHSTLERLESSSEQICAAMWDGFFSSSLPLHCVSSFALCRWLRGGDGGVLFFGGRPHGVLPFAPTLAPDGDYLVGIAGPGTNSFSLSTCPYLCSLDEVTVSLRVWRAPWVTIQLCFVEHSATMCEWVAAENGLLFSEVLPQTESFSISLRFGNLSAGDAVLIDDLAASFRPCPSSPLPPFPPPSPSSASPPLLLPLPEPVTASITHLSFIPHPPPLQILPPSPPAPQPLLRVLSSQQRSSSHGLVHLQALSEPSTTFSTPPSFSLSTRPLSRFFYQTSPAPSRKQSRSLPTRSLSAIVSSTSASTECDDDSCRQPSPPPPLHFRVCNGVVMEGACRSLCRAQQLQSGRPAGGGRCLPDPEAGRSRCVCGLRMAPPSLPATRPFHPNSLETLVLNDEAARCASHDECTHVKCDSGMYPGCLSGECSCSSCLRHLCDFERGGECGWGDLSPFAPTRFSNITIAAKRHQNNRYGISRLSARSMSGLVRLGRLRGPLSLSLDVFPSHRIIIRVCLDSLSACQSQMVEPNAWNRVTARIRIKRAYKIFILFYNKAVIEKSVAIDNISLDAGDCFHDSDSNNNIHNNDINNKLPQ